MEKPKINYAVDMLMVVSFIVVAITGLVLLFFLPDGIQRGGYQQFLGVTKHVWTDVHNWSGITLIVLVILHLILHWNWLVAMTKSVFSRKKK